MTSINEENLEGIIEKLNNKPRKSLYEKLDGAFDFLYALDVGGSLIRKYQKRIADKIGWKEKNLTIANAISCGLVPSLFYSGANYFFGDRISDSFQDLFYNYPAFLLSQNFFRIAYSQTTKKAIGSIGIYNVVGTSIYAISDFVKSKRKK